MPQFLWSAVSKLCTAKDNPGRAWCVSELRWYCWKPRKAKAASSWERVPENRELPERKVPEICGGHFVIFSLAPISESVEDTIQGQGRESLKGLVGTTFLLTQVSPQYLFLPSGMENLIIHGHQVENSSLATEVGKICFSLNAALILSNKIVKQDAKDQTLFN